MWCGPLDLASRRPELPLLVVVLDLGDEPGDAAALVRVAHHQLDGHPRDPAPPPGALGDHDLSQRRISAELSACCLCSPKEDRENDTHRAPPNTDHWPPTSGGRLADWQSSNLQPSNLPHFSREITTFPLPPRNCAQKSQNNPANRRFKLYTFAESLPRW